MTIDDVIGRLTDIVREARRTSSRLGYFPALYRTVTIEVQRAIADGRFDDGPRLERLDVVFAGRYLDALDAFHRGAPVTRSWRVAFDGAAHPGPTILQQVLVGINAHIKLDLGIAAAEVAPGAALSSLKADFDRINAILGSLVEGVEREIAEVSPGVQRLVAAGGRVDDALVGFSLKGARGFAWNVAQGLAPLTKANRERKIAELDLAVSLLGHALLHPPPLTSASLLAIRLHETADPSRVIDLLTREYPLP